MTYPYRVEPAGDQFGANGECLEDSSKLRWVCRTQTWIRILRILFDHTGSDILTIYDNLLMFIAFS